MGTSSLAPANLANMSMVVFPFKAEDPAVAEANLDTAARHPRISRVLAVAAEPDPLFDRLATAAAEISSRTGLPVEAIVQERIGELRPGKGDAMNTGLGRFLATDEDRIHFYDADITNFDASWVDGAERAADRGYPVVRHYFPRVSTDAMITWMVTRPGFALTHPNSVLWKIEQPLGGELLLTREAAEKVATMEMVRARSDWGIDTVLTYATAATGLPVYEHFVADGKQHRLYGSLADLRTMVVECFQAVQDLARLPSPGTGEHRVEPEVAAPAAISHRVGYDVESSLHLLTEEWTAAEVEAASLLPRRLAGPMLANRVRPTFAFLDAGAWFDALTALLESYRRTPGWQGVLFRLWVARVLAYTTTDALAGHSRALEILRATVGGYAADRSATADTPRTNPKT